MLGSYPRPRGGSNVKGKAYEEALADRADEIAWARASIEEKFVEATAEANRLIKLRKKFLGQASRKVK